MSPNAVNEVDSSRRAAASPKPVAKANIIHQQILSGLLTANGGTRTHKVWDQTLNDGKGGVVETKVPVASAPVLTTRTEIHPKNVKKGKDGVWRHDLVEVNVPVPTLAGNVSTENVERAARRWIR